MEKVFRRRAVIALLIFLLIAFIVAYKFFFAPSVEKAPAENVGVSSCLETTPEYTSLDYNPPQKTPSYHAPRVSNNESFMTPEFKKIDNRSRFVCREVSNKRAVGYKSFCFYREGLSFDIGGQFIWMSLPKFNFSDNTASSGNETGWGGGLTGKITYQQPREVFAQLRATYNSVDMSADNRIDEGYAELVAGYCFPVASCLSLTPYVGVGYDNLKDSSTTYSSVNPAYAAYGTMVPSYETYYGIAGFDTHYAWAQWKLGAQFDFYFPFQQKVDLAFGSPSLDKNVGCAARLPIARRLTQHIWLELTPYYRFFVLGSGSNGTYALDERNINQAGAFLTLRVFV